MIKVEMIHRKLTECVLERDVRESDGLTAKGLVDVCDVSKAPVCEILIMLLIMLFIIIILKPVLKLRNMLVPLKHECIEDVLEMQDAIELKLFDRITSEGKLDVWMVEGLRKIYELGHIFWILLMATSHYFMSPRAQDEEYHMGHFRSF